MAKEEENSEKNQQTNDLKEPEDNVVQSHHNVVIDGKEINYTVTAGKLVLTEEEEEDEKSKGEKAKASIFFVAYTRDEVEESNKRPITFSFNGGPGSSSVWLHLGVLGPRKIELDDDGYPLPPPYRLIDNNWVSIIIDFSDVSLAQCQMWFGHASEAFIADKLKFAVICRQKNRLYPFDLAFSLKPILNKLCD